MWSKHFHPLIAEYSIHFLLHCLSRSGLQTQQFQQGSPKTPLFGHLYQLFWEDPELTPRQPRDIVSPVCPAPGSPPRWTCQEHFPREGSRRHPDQMPGPPQLVPYNAKEQRLHFEPLPDVRPPYPISKAEPSHPAEKANFNHLYWWPCSFGHYLQILTIGEGWEVHGSINRDLHFMAQSSLHPNGYLQHRHYSWCHPDLPVHLSSRSAASHLHHTWHGCSGASNAKDAGSFARISSPAESPPQLP